MSLYFFDLKSAGIVSRDEQGIELPDAEAAHDTAVAAIIDAARSAIQEGASNQFHAIEVRNGTGPVLEVTAVFNSRIFRTQ